MIRTKDDLKYYLLCDEYARFGKKVSFFRKLRLGEMWSFNISLRKLEYYTNTDKKILKAFYKFKIKKLGMKLGWSIPANVFGPGLCIVHYGTVIVNAGAKIGANCRIHSGVNIGANGGGNSDTPRLGHNVYIGPGAKLFGQIRVGNNCVIAANSVVNRSFDEDNVTIGGIPAKIISKKDSGRFIKGL
ncbi:serine O-acetyltransferase, partial [uncultured Clostridium sp.]|uniref:serine O-acetyltransferase n=1 Tax=uncultured Clostridium sp. TaxID=59620 RepID=UPI0025FCB87C